MCPLGQMPHLKHDAATGGTKVFCVTAKQLAADKAVEAAAEAAATAALTLQQDERHCFTTKGDTSTRVPNGWRGLGDGDNACNTCACNSGKLTCTTKLCGEKVRRPFSLLIIVGTDAGIDNEVHERQHAAAARQRSMANCCSYIC